jgi:hypothetical protein
MLGGEQVTVVGLFYFFLLNMFLSMWIHFCRAILLKNEYFCVCFKNGFEQQGDWTMST